ncbi:hypothetical protein FGG39_gp14 [Mycobacterium phage Saintus]|uniref:Uncharacterized protein n=1 Tax=Mycobacterium phage Saintus TaxID=2923007 RepID=G8IRH1_9CAUD|nr:hypothetical protein FGG39_gp14 [Mycobacterium phage Saintus]AER26471.1 hypothetical protein SAINTUS_88 [Mycobacterium phage Saintus]
MYEVWARDIIGNDCYITGDLDYGQASRIADNITMLSPDVRAWIEEI